MRYLKKFESIYDEKLDKIKLLNNPEFYINSFPLPKNSEFTKLNLIYHVEDKIKDIFKGCEFEKSVNTYDIEFFLIKVKELNISILEMKDEYFLVIIIDRSGSLRTERFMADQIDGLLALLTDIHQIIYS
jgi:hypothetical protein